MLLTQGVHAGSTLRSQDFASATQLLVGNSTRPAQGFFEVNASTLASATSYVLTVSSNNGGTTFAVENSGHVVSSGTTPSVVCNAGTPVMLADSNDMSGEFTGGTASANCTVTFRVPFRKKPRCFCQDGTSVLALKATTTTTTLICTAAVSIGTDAVMYGCHAAP